jgi:ribonuclease G
MTIDTLEKCPMCDGGGKIDSSLLLIDQIESKIANLTVIKSNKIQIATHPFVASYINKGWFFSSIRHKWEKKFTKTIQVIGDDRLHLLQYSIIKK